MLVLTRKVGEKILIPSIHTSIEVVEVKGERVRLGIQAPKSVKIVREELADSTSSAAPAAPATNQEHTLRNKLNLVALGLNIVQRQLEDGSSCEAAATIAEMLRQIAPAQPAATPVAPAQPTQPAGPTVLVVEDDASEREMLASILRSAGLEVTTAVDGVDALNVLQRSSGPQLIMLDMMMPRCDGMTTVRILRRNPVFDGIKIVAMSGYGREQFGIAERAAGIDGWYEKPIDPERLIREIKELLDMPVAGAV